MYSSHSIVRVTCLRLSSRRISAQSGSTWRRWPCLVPAAANSAVSSAVSVISAGNGQLNPALASRFKVNRTVDGETPTRRAISLSPTPAVLKRSTSRTWRIVVLSAAIHSPMQKPKERTLIGPAEAPLNRATSSRNGGRNHLGTPSDIKSEWWATSSRIRGRLPPESAAETKKDAVAALEAFVEPYQIKYQRAADCLTKNRDALLALYDFPAEHWKHLRTTNPIESTFATVRHRTIRSKGCLL